MTTKGTAMGWRAVYLTETHLHLDDGCTPAPAGWWGGGLGELLTRLAPRMSSESVLLLSGEGARLLGLPDDPAAPLPKGGLHDHPAIQDAARAGWGCSAIGDWSTFKREGSVVRLGLVHMMDLAVDKLGAHPAFPLAHKDVTRTLRALRSWHELTGSAWYGTPGMAGLQIMQNLAPHKGDRKRQAPTWNPAATKSGQAQGWGPDGAVEDDYRASQWGHTAGGHNYVQWYDKNRAYIAAAMVTEVCPWTLKHTGRTAWNQRLAGWWQIEIAPWNDPRLPDPAGYLSGNPLVRWVTGPRMALLHELTDQGVYGGYRVLDSWTGPARDHELRPWAERMRDAYAGRREIDDPVVRYMVGRAVKDAGRATLGMLDRASNWAYRPDWWSAVVAMNGANVWRAARKIVQAGGTVARIDVDAIAVATDQLDPVAAAPAGLGELDPSGELLGRYKPKTTLRVRQQVPA